jgi:hypothetical protein
MSKSFDGLHVRRAVRINPLFDTIITVTAHKNTRDHNH